MSFANPAGAWAFLAVAAVLVIHLLQRRPRRRSVSTLFLLEAATARSLGGRKVDRLRRSTSLWLQLLTAGLLGFLILGPRRLSEDSVQKVAVVLDSTASMSAFRDRAHAAVLRRTKALERRASRTEWVLLESTLRGPALYAGRDGEALRRALSSWDPRQPGHDLLPALDTARGLAGSSGLVLLVTDHAFEAPAGVERLAVGRAVDNVGFAGARVEGDGESFRVIVRNHGREAATRRWGLADPGGPDRRGELSLAPGEMRALTGTFPAGRDRVELFLDPDLFPLDDRLPLLRPQPKALRLDVAPSATGLPFVARFVSTLQAVSSSGGGGGAADLFLLAGPAGPRPSAPGPSVLFLMSAPGSRLLPAAAVSGSHPLLDDLDWTGLRARESAGFGEADGERAGAPDEVLLWSGARPLVVLAHPLAGPQLVVNFPLEGSSAPRVPAFPLMLHRFVEEVRAEVVGRERANVESGQELRVALDPQRGTATIESADGRRTADAVIRAPLAPGFFRIAQDGEERLTAAAHFADTAEADLTRAESREEGGEDDGRATARNSRDDPYTAALALLAGALLVADWALLARGA